jgi:hypothetical protein
MGEDGKKKMIRCSCYIVYENKFIYFGLNFELNDDGKCIGKM